MSDSHVPSEGVIALGDRTVHLNRREVQSPDGVEVLTPLETSLLAYLFERPNQVVSKQELLVKVWGYHASTRTRAPSLLVSRLRRKLGDELENPLFLRTVRGTGYQLRVATEPPPSPSVPDAPPAHQAPAPLVDLPDPSFPITAAEARRLRRLRPSLSALPSGDYSPTAVRARLMVAWCDLLAGDPPELERLWRDAEQTDHPDLPRLCATLALRAVEASGTRPAVLQAAARTRRLLQSDSIDDAIARCMVALIQCTAHARLGELAEARAQVEEASALAEQVRLPKLQVLVSDRLAFLDRRAHRFKRAHQHMHDAQMGLESCDCIETQMEVVHNLATLHYAAGNLEDARKSYEDALALATRLGSRSGVGTVSASLVAVCLNEGRVADAEIHLDALHQAHGPGQQRRHELLLAYHTARIHIECGRLADAGGLLERAVHLAGRAGEQRVGGFALLLLVWLGLMTDAAEDAEDALEDLQAVVDELGDRELQGAHALFSMWSAVLQDAPTQAHAEAAQRLLKVARSPLAIYVGGPARPGQEWLRSKCDALLAHHGKLTRAAPSA